MSATDANAAEEAVDRTLERAKASIQSARFTEAASALTALLAEGLSRGRRIDALYTLAVAHRYAKAPERALPVLDELLADAPDYGRAHQERGHTLLALNRPEGAAAAFAKAVELNPGLLASWKALASLHEQAGRTADAGFARAQAEYLATLPPDLANTIDLIHEGRLYKAEQLCRRFLRHHPHHIEGMRLLADIGERLGIYDDAEFLLESCVELAPENVRARSDYLRLLNRKGKFAKAYDQARILADMQPANPAFQLSKAAALMGLGRLEEAVELYERSLPASPNQPGVYVLLGHARKALGALDEAVACYRKAYELRPDYGDAFWSLANTKTYRFTDEEIEHIRRYEAAAHVATDDRVHLSFAAGKALEDRGEHDESFRYYARGNALKRERSRYDPDRTERMIQAQIEICTKDLFERRGHLGFDAPDPIFIVGLPRAGSTLLEQILASHSMVDGTMELHDILSLAQRLRGRSAHGSSEYPANLRNLDGEYFGRFGRQYIENTRVYRGKAPLFIDKMPNNFMHVGLIRLILPRAKVIDARRHPMACCFSGFKQLFGEGQDFTYGLDTIGRYYRGYVRLMEHWDAVLPGFVLRVVHEDVVEDLETQVRRMLDFCGLPFEAQCLEFHRTRRSVRTPSSEQVRQPIYRGGLEQWRRYEPHLEPLREALGKGVLARWRGSGAPPPDLRMK